MIKIRKLENNDFNKFCKNYLGLEPEKGKSFINDLALSVIKPKYKEGVKDVDNKWIEIAKEVGKELNLDFDKIDIYEFAKGIEIEHEHDDIIEGNHILSAKIALAHLKELSDYYTRLIKMEEEGEAEKE